MSVVARRILAGVVLCIALALPASAGAAAYHDLVGGTSSLRAYWRLGETFGTSAAAVKGPFGEYRNTPFLGAASLLRSSSNFAVDLTGASNQHMRVAPQASVDVATAFTLEAWIRVDSAPASTRYIICKGGSYALRLKPDNDLEVVMVRSDSAWLTTDTNPEDRPAVGQTYHVVGSYDGNNLSLYVNGHLADREQVGAAQVKPTLDDLNIGACNGWEGWDGVIDEPAIYDAALTPAEVQAHYEAGADGTPPAAPAGVKATSGDREVTVDWNGSGDADTVGYRVFRSSGGGAYTQVGGETIDTSYVDTSVTNGTPYSYVVRAVDKHGLISADSAVATTTPVASTRYRDAILATEGLQSYLRLSDAAGSTSAIAARGDNGTINGVVGGFGSAGLLTKDSNTAIDFDGIDDRITVPDSEALDLTDQVTLEAWVRLDQTPTEHKHVLCKHNVYCIAIETDGRPHFGTGINAAYGGPRWPSPLAVGQRYHLVGTYDGEWTRLYVNGAIVSEFAKSGTLGQNSAPLEIGSWNGGGRWPGIIDEPAVYDTALTPADVKRHYDLGAGGSPPAAPSGLVATAGDGLAALDWADNAEADLEGYDVFRASTSGGAWMKLNQNRLKGSRFTDFTAANGVTYRYIVKATNTVGRTSAASAQTTAKPRVPSSYRDAVLTNAGLRHLWRLDERNGIVAAAEKGVPGEFREQPQLARPSLLRSDTGNLAVRFSKNADKYMEVAPGPHVDLSSAFTLEAWATVDTAPTSENYIMCKEGAYALRLMPDNDLQVVLVRDDGTWFVSETPLANRPALNTTYHVTGTYDGATLRLYVNGVQVDSDPVTGLVKATGAKFNVGACSGYSAWQGVIDEPAVYDVALTQAQVKEHYDVGVDNTAPSGVTGLTATNGDGTVALDWADNATTDLAGYDVFRSSTTGGPYTKANGTRLTVSAFSDTELPNGKPVFYVVRAVDKAGNASANSAEIKGTPTSKPVLIEPETLHADGAELRWTGFDAAVDGTFERYEVHRSSSSGFTPSSTTLLATIRDAGVTRYRDTTARAGATFTYKLTTNGSPSGEWTVTLPADGQARKRLQPDTTFGKATYIREGTCANRGGDPAIRVGTTTTGRVRGLVGFDLRDVPATATVSRATLSLYASTAPPIGATIGAHAATGAWPEGTGRGTCTGDGTTWSEVQAGVPWQAAGGDFDPNASSSVTRVSGSSPGWDDFDLTATAQKWVAGTAPNHGVLLKASDETLADGKLVTYYSDATSTAPTLRPRLIVDYADGSRPAGPTVAVTAPAAGDRVSGSAVKITADAQDDRRVDKVQFLDGTTSIVTDTSAPFEATWNTTAAGVANGTHTLKAVATDDAGNVTTSSTVDVTVANSASPTATVSAAPGAYADTVKGDNPTAYYRMDDAVGSTVVNDSSGNARHGVYVGPNNLGQAGLTGDGNTAVTVPRAVHAYPRLDGLSSAGATSSQAMSVETWFNHTPVAGPDQYDNIIERGWGGWATNQGRWTVYTTTWADYGPGVCFAISPSGGGQETACAPAPSGRIHVVGSYDGENVRIYANGVLHDTDNAPGIVLDTTAMVDVLNSNTQDVKVDDIALYNSALSPAKVQAHYEAAGPAAYDTTVKADGPSGYWRLGETSGTALADSSGAGRTATLSGAATVGQPALIGRGGSDRSVRFANDSAGDGKASVGGLTGILGGPFTAEAWIDYAGPAGVDEWQTVMSRHSGQPGGWSLAVYQSSSGNGEQLARFSLMDAAGENHYLRIPMTPGRNHLVGAFTGTQKRIYVNGRLVQEGAMTMAPNTSSPLEIGGRNDNGELLIDEVAVFDKALSHGRVAEHYAAGQGRILEGAAPVKATATDDGTVDNVEFLLDGKPFHTDTVAPYETTLPTPSDTDPAYDGSHVLTTRSTDNHGKQTTSNPLNITVSNSKPSQKADVTSTPVPDGIAWDPGATAAQEDQGVDVSVANSGDATLKAVDTDLRYRWVRPDGTTAATGDKPLSADVRAGDAVLTRVSVPPPALLAGVQKAKHQLQFDLVDKKSGAVLSNKGNKPKDKPVEVERKSEVGLGLERFYHYEGEQLGAGMQHMVNLASGNSIMRITPFQAPGRGLSTVLDMTYNGLEDKSRSPAGNNWSLAISGLTPLGMQLDPHPNKADEIGGRSNKYVELVDADGTRHRFDGKAAADGTTYWEEPAGVHLYLRVYSTSDSSRRWALTRPDRVTFFFDADGYPTSVQDKNGNRITYRLEDTPPGEDPGGPKKRIVAVTDAGGRSFTIAYYTKADIKKAHVRGKIKRITDHTGSPLDLEYYEDGNLRRLVQRGGTSAQGILARDRAWVFSYTTSNGEGPALATAAERSNPPEKVGNQSTRIYSVRDPRGNESRFAYLGSGNGNDRWKLASRTDRAGQTTGYSYDTLSRVTTVTKPLSRVTKYTFDGDGKVTKIVDPKNQQTLVTWTGDRHVKTMTDPHLSTELSPRYREFAYNANGALVDVWNQARERTNFEMENVAVDGNDVSGKWKAGRSIPHISQLKRKTTPKGMATATPLDDFQTVLDYDTKGNQIKVTDEEGHAEQTFYNADGTINKITDPLNHSTTYPTYDANGLPTSIVDGNNQGKTSPEKTQMAFDADGLLLWLQDPNHTFDSGSNGREYRTYFEYDPFHRLTRQSAPKSTRFQRGGANIIWTGAEYDANDNVVTQVHPHYAATYTGAGAKMLKRYDAMDRPDLVTGPDRSADPAGERTAFQYDAAGRLIKKTSPRGVQSSIANDFETIYDYDPLDRVTIEKRYETDGAGTVTKTLRTHRCYETDGDLKSVTTPRANVATVDCAAPPGFTKKFEYDAAHRVIKVTNAANEVETTEYDANGNVTAKVNRRKARTEMAYDERDIAIRKVEPLDQDAAGATTRPITTLFEYDGARNLKREISPRGFDVNGGAPPFNDYVTTYTYDNNDQRTRTELPSKGGVGKTYVHETYDANGNQTSISQPVTDSASAPADQKETRTYWDPAWIRTSQQPGDPKVHYDYTAEGWQSHRTPEKTPTGGGLNLDRQSIKTFFPDGHVREEHDRGGQLATYRYDAENNLTYSDVAKSTKPTEKTMTMTASYDTMNRQSRVRHKKLNEANWKTSTFEYDLGSNTIVRVEEIEESDAGAQVKPGRRHEFTFDVLDRATRQVDFGADASSGGDDRQMEWTFNPSDKPLTRVAKKRDAASAFTQGVQTTTYGYWSNDKPKRIETKNGSGVVMEAHDVTYTATENGRSVYLNGNKSTDTFTRKSPDGAAPCQSASCTNTYQYDPRGRLTQDQSSRAGTTSTTDYELDPAGNMKTQKKDGVTQKSMTYTGNKIKTATEGGQTSNYFYKDGNVDCVTRSGGTQGDCSPAQGQSNANVLEDYSFDGLDRLEAHRSFGSSPSSSQYTHDAMDRVTEQTEQQGSSAPKTTKRSYIGMSNSMNKEESTQSGQATRNREYSYDANGERISMSDNAGGTKRDYTYGQDSEGNVSQLISSSGGAQAAYGYTAYGEQDKSMTRENDPVTGGATTDSNPLNPYRYEGRRYDTASKSLEMGARRYSPSSAHFIQQDGYEDAVSDFGISQDPLTSNRYSFEGANPVNFVEIDGHDLLDDAADAVGDAKDAVEDGVDSVRRKASSTARSAKRTVSSASRGVKRAASSVKRDVSETASDVKDSVSSAAKDAGDAVSNAANDAKEAAPGAIKKAKGVVDKVNAGQQVVESAAQGIEHAGKEIGSFTRGKTSKAANAISKGAGKVGKVAGAVGKVTGPVGSALGFADDVAGGKPVDRAAGKAVGSAAGGRIGGMIGGTIGSAAGPLGTIAGTAVGSAIGSWAGGEVGEEVGDAVGDAAEDVGDTLGL